MEGIHDPKTYYKMCEPFAGRDEANEALDGFFSELRELRAKHGIPDVAVVVRIELEDAGEVGSSMARSHIGSTLWAETMLTWALGQETADHAVLLEKLLSSGKRRGRV